MTRKNISISNNIADRWAEIEQAAQEYGREIGVQVGVAVFVVNVLWKQYKENMKGGRK